MKDVAREAKVSVSTVSNYLNGRTVREPAATNIKNAIKELNYVRNDNARFLKTQKSKVVIFVIPNVWSPYFSELTFWVQKYLDEHGYKMLLCISENDYAKEQQYVTMAEEQRVAGIISVSYSELTQHVRSTIPLVSIEKETTGRFSLVSSDNYSGGKLAAEEFQKRGITNYVFIGSTNKDSDSTNARKSGFLDYCNNHGLKAYGYEVSPSSNQLHSQIKKIVEQCKELSGKIGIFTFSDEVGIHVLNECLSEGINVPNQMQIIGFDGWNITPHTPLNLSSIRQPVDQIALTTVDQLIKEIENPKEYQIQRISLPVTFKVGNTTLN